MKGNDQTKTRWFLSLWHLPPEAPAFDTQPEYAPPVFHQAFDCTRTYRSVEHCAASSMPSRESFSVVTACMTASLARCSPSSSEIRLGFVHARRDHYPALGSPSEVWLVKLCGWRSVSRKPWCSADTNFLSFSSGPAGVSLEYTKSGRSPMLGVSSQQSSIFHGCCRLGHP